MSISGHVSANIGPGIEVRYLHSNILRQRLQLQIKLPWGYDHSKQAYPALYALDGNRSFPLYSTTSLILETPPSKGDETVIIGIGYELDPDRLTGLAQWAAWRVRDLTPVHSEETEQAWKVRLAAQLKAPEIVVSSGGAAAFLESIRTEVIPFIESHYRVSPAERGLAGYSFGGLFVLYTLFRSPGMFTRFFAGSPSLWDELFQYERQYADAHRELVATLL